MDGCFFCNLYRELPQEPGGVVFEDEHFYAYHFTYGKESTYLGHLLLVTKRHVRGLADLYPAEAQAMGAAIGHLSKALQKATHAEKIYLEAFYEVNPHLHLHLTARYPGTPEEYWRGKIFDWQGAPTGGEKEIGALCDQLRLQLVTDSAS